MIFPRSEAPSRPRGRRNACQGGQNAESRGIATLAGRQTIRPAPVSGFHTPALHLRGITHRAPCPGFGVSHTGPDRRQPVDSLGGTPTRPSGDHPRDPRGNRHPATGERPPGVPPSYRNRCEVFGFQAA